MSDYLSDTIASPPAQSLGFIPYPPERQVDPQLRQVQPASPPAIPTETSPQPIPTEAAPQPIPTEGIGFIPYPPEKQVDPQLQQYQPPPQQAQAAAASTPETQGPLGSLIAGALDAIREGRRLATGEGFTDQPQQAQPQRGFFGNLLYGLAHGAPTAALGFGGAMGGEALAGPPGAIAGGVLGFGGGTLLQELVPAYDQARARGLDHDAAVDEAIRSAGASGAIAGLTAPLFSLSPFRSAISNILLHGAVTSPAVGAAGRVAVPLATGQPMPSAEEFATGAGADIIGGVGTGAAFHVLAGRRAPQEGVRGQETPPEGQPAPEGAPPEQPPPAPAQPGAEPVAAVPPSTPTGAPDIGVAAGEPGTEPSVAAPRPEEPPPSTPSPALAPEAAPLAERAPGPAPREAPTGPERVEPTTVADLKPGDTVRMADGNDYQVSHITPPDEDTGNVQVGFMPEGATEPHLVELSPEAQTSRLTTEPSDTVGQEALAAVSGTAGLAQPAPTTGPITARLPGEQARLDQVVQQLGTAQQKLQQLQGIQNPTRSQQRALAKQQATVARLTNTRENLRAPPPLQPGGYKPPGAPRDFRDYKFNNDVPVYQQAFQDAGHDPRTAVNYPIAQQNEILRNQTSKKFGFRDVQLAPGHDPFETRNHLLDLYRAAQDMTAALQMPHDMASIMGRVGIKLEPTGGRKGYLGYYDPATRTIVMTGRSNTFGHEWGHALDHWMVDMLPKQQTGLRPLFTTYARNRVLDPKEPLTARIARVINTMFYDEGELAARKMQLQTEAAQVNRQGQPTQTALRAQQQLEQLAIGGSRMQIKSSEYRTMSARFGDPSYWASEFEMFARMNEAYLARQIEQSGGDPRGVVMPDEAYSAMNDRRLRMTFPKDAELMANVAAFDHLYDGIRLEKLAGSIPGAMAKPGTRSDPTLWARLGPVGLKATTKKALHETVDNFRNWQDTLRSTRLTDPERPEGARTLAQRMADGGRQIVYSKMGVMEAIHHLAPDAAKPHVQAIMDRLGLTPGQQRYVGETFSEGERALARIWMNKFAGILKEFGIRPNRLTQEQKLMLHHTMTTGEVSFPRDDGSFAPIPQRFVGTGEALRKLSDEVYQAHKNAGIDIGYAESGFWSRMYDHARIFADSPKFIRQAKLLHEFMFDKDMADNNHDPAHLVKRWNQLSPEERAMAPGQTQKDMQALAKLVREQQSGQITQAPSVLDQKIQALMGRVLPDVRTHIADMASNNWYTRVVTGYLGDYQSTGPSGSYLNHRVLPPEADQIMRDFIDTDPTSALPRYYSAAARKIAYTKAFGEDHAILKDLLKKAAEGGLHGDDMDLVKKIVGSVTGTTDNTRNTAINRVASYIHAGVALALMPRAVWSMVTEPFVGALAHGDVRAGLRSFGNQLGQILHTAGGIERAEIADFIGVTTSAMHDDMILARTGRDYANTPALGRFMGNFYRTIGLTQYNNSSRRASMGAMNWLLQKYSRDFLSTEKGVRWDNRRAEARGAFNEFGIAPEVQQRFAQWMLAHDGMPSLQELQTHEMAPVYGLAIRRMVDRAMQDPYKTDRPLVAEQGWLSLTLQFMSFNYGFQRNVLDPMLARIGRSYSRAAERAELAGGGGLSQFAHGMGAGGAAFSGMAAIAASYVAAGVLPTAMRQFLFSRDQWDEHDQKGDLGEWLFGLAMSRSGLGGTIDPITQVATNLKFESDLNSILEGAGVNWYAKNGYDLMAPFLPGGPPSDSTNTRYHNAVRAAYNLAATPIEAYIATRLGAFGQPIRFIAGGGLQKLTSPGVSEAAATAVTGPKGAKLPQEPTGFTKLQGLGGEKLGSLTKLGAEEKQAGAGDRASQVGGVPWGLLDDVIAPTAKVAAPLWQAVPTPIKAAVAGAGALYGAGKFVSDMAPYRAQPAPPKRSTQP